MTTLNAEFTKDFLELKMSARNALEGKVSNVKYDHEICLVEIQLETPQTVKAVITTDSAKRLEIKRGAKMFAVIKATEVMVAR
jgi:molybdopterin-binding protein